MSEATLRRHGKSRRSLSRTHSEKVCELGRVLHALGRASPAIINADHPEFPLPQTGAEKPVRWDERLFG